jgi:ribonuclease HI
MALMCSCPPLNFFDQLKLTPGVKQKLAERNLTRIADAFEKGTLKSFFLSNSLVPRTTRNQLVADDDTLLPEHVPRTFGRPWKADPQIASARDPDFPQYCSQIICATDGSAKAEDQRAGIGVYFGKNCKWNISSFPHNQQDILHAEVCAVEAALTTLPSGTTAVTMIIDNQAVFSNITTWECKKPKDKRQTPFSDYYERIFQLVHLKHHTRHFKWVRFDSHVIEKLSAENTPIQEKQKILTKISCYTLTGHRYIIPLRHLGHHFLISPTPSHHPHHS